MGLAAIIKPIFEVLMNMLLNYFMSPSVKKGPDAPTFLKGPATDPVIAELNRKYDHGMLT